MSIYTQGVHGSGARDYKPEQVQKVVAALLGGCSTVAAITSQTGVAGRTVRNIISDRDGIDFLLGGDGNGYQLAVDDIDASRLTSRFLSQVDRMRARVRRRLSYTVPSVEGDGS